mmetsp:Transcript_29236/g.67806  ORF Transcript_29236/g.67806 Transcript_29236/m.67806 type:complete len:200 (+) Transcript_29236:4950-5549(+)
MVWTWRKFKRTSLMTSYPRHLELFKTLERRRLRHQTTLSRGNRRQYRTRDFVAAGGDLDPEAGGKEGRDGGGDGDGGDGGGDGGAIDTGCDQELTAQELTAQGQLATTHDNARQPAWCKTSRVVFTLWNQLHAVASEGHVCHVAPLSCAVNAMMAGVVGRLARVPSPGWLSCWPGRPLTRLSLQTDPHGAKWTSGRNDH